MINEAVDALKALALGGPENEPKVRVAGLGGRIYVDLGQANWDAVEIGVDGWRILPRPPIKFIRPTGFRPLPRPEHGGTLNDLRPFINIRDDDDYAVLVAFLLAALRPEGPYWQLTISGEPGSGKSAASRVVRELLDPNMAAVRSLPTDEESFILAAKNSWLATFDNVGKLSAPQSDRLCRLTTGAGFGRQKRYSHDEYLACVCRPVLLNGIAELVERADLGSRTLALALPPIPRHSRHTEAEHRHRFEEAKPRILGALYEGVSLALGKSAELELPGLPRMADATHFACAAAPALGRTATQLLDVLMRNARALASGNLEDSPLVPPLKALIRTCGGSWTGTASELLRALRSQDRGTSGDLKNWPTSPRMLSSELRSLAPDLRNILDIDLVFDTNRTGGRRPIFVREIDVPADGPADDPFRAEPTS